MNNKLKKALRRTFSAPMPTRKLGFLDSLPHPKGTNLAFFFSQMGYIRKRFWCLSLLLLLGMMYISSVFRQGREVVGVLSAVLPLLTLTGITEVGKSMSFQMSEFEMSCKYNLAKITLIRLSVIGTFHFIILVITLLVCKDQSQYALVRYALYGVTPFLLSSYLSFWVTNHIKSKDAFYICGGATAFVSIGVWGMGLNSTGFYEASYSLFWGIAFLIITVLLTKEIYFLLTERSKQWSFA